MSLNLLREVSSYNYDENTGEEIKTFNSIAHEDDILQFYLKEIGKIKLLKSEEGYCCKAKTYSGKLASGCEHCKKIRWTRCIVHGFGSGGFNRIN